MVCSLSSAVICSLSLSHYPLQPLYFKESLKSLFPFGICLSGNQTVTGKQAQFSSETIENTRKLNDNLTNQFRIQYPVKYYLKIKMNGLLQIKSKTYYQKLRNQPNYSRRNPKAIALRQKENDTKWKLKCTRAEKYHKLYIC